MEVTAAGGGGGLRRQDSGEEKQSGRKRLRPDHPHPARGDRLEQRERERGFVLLPPPNDPFLAPPVVNGVTEMRRYHFTDPFGEVDPGTKKTKAFSGRENIAPRKSK